MVLTLLSAVFVKPTTLELWFGVCVRCPTAFFAGCMRRIPGILQRHRVEYTLDIVMINGTISNQIAAFLLRKS